MPVLQLDTVKDTSLWQLLNSGFSGAEEEIAKTLTLNLIGICQEAYDRMKNFPSLHPEYTLHDEVHCLRVTELMFRVMPQSVISILNPLEIALLILSAHFHDQGMVLEKGEIEALKSNTDFRIFQDNWVIDHPNIQAVRERLRDKNLSEEEHKRHRETEHELDAAMLTDYVRITHGERSATFIRSVYSGDPRWVVSGANLAEFVARLSLSHVRPATDLTPTKGFRYDEVIGPYKVNMTYLGLVLRLADILDLDRDRTPDSLYRTIDFRSQVSLREWEKHRSVDGWAIELNKVQFTMRCEHPEYQRAAYQFMEWIDKELADAHSISRNFPAEFARYKFELPLNVDRSRIEPKDNAYTYYDLEFSLSRDEIIKLLMTEKLYGGPWLSIRELLQNSLDALRYRRALMKRDGGADWLLGKIVIQHSLDEYGHEVIRCTDNGIGMDESIIKHFLTRVGRSYYRSPEFEQERIGLSAAGVDFDPCAQFGIGFMSCFMLGDRIKVYTRRDYGPLRGQGEPLIVEINGLGNIIVIRKGIADQPTGTTVEITGRKKPRGLEKWQDNVRLIEVLNGYALACEFPIEGYCTIPEIAGSTSIPPQIAPPLTSMERANIRTCLTLEQNFSEVHPLLNGIIRSSFLIDETGRFSLENCEAAWRVEGGKLNPVAKLICANGQEVKEYHRFDGQTCIDGILVAGQPGRDDKEDVHSLGSYSNVIGLGRGSFVLDIRGHIKPPLTPARRPPDSAHTFLRRDLRWDYVQKLALQTQGRLWEKVAQQLGNGLDDEIFWQLAIIYNHTHSLLHWMRASVIWSLISVPVVDVEGKTEWRKISSLGVLEPVSEQEGGKKPSYRLNCADGKHIGAHETLTQWLPDNEKDNVDWDLRNLVATMCTVILKDGQPHLELRSPSEPNSPPWLNVLTGFKANTIALSYAGEVTNFIAVNMPFRNVNKEHPLVREAIRASYQEEKTALQAFAHDAVRCLSDPETSEVIAGTKETGRWQRNVGFLYDEVDWQSISTELRPPYTVRMENGDSVQANVEVFERWAKAETNRNA